MAVACLELYESAVLKILPWGILPIGGGIMVKGISKQVIVVHAPEPQLFEVDVLSDVCFGPKNQGLSQEEIEKRAKEALSLVGLDESFYTLYNIMCG